MEHLDWGLPLAIDLFAAGLGAAILLVAAVADLAGGRRYRRISTTGALLAPWPVILGLILLIVDLGKPGRFWEMILRRSHETLGVESLMFKFGSTMSLGTWILVVFIIGSLVYLVVAILAWPFPWAGKLQKLLSAAGIPFALLVTTYTGVLMSGSENSLWSNWLLPVLFVVSAIVTGIAAIIFVLSIFQLFSPESKIGINIPKLELLDSWIIVFQFLVVILFVVIGIRSAQMKALIGSAYGLLWWIGIIGLGLIVPFVVWFFKQAKKPYMSLVISTLVLLGGFFLRYAILYSGQIQI